MNKTDRMLAIVLELQRRGRQRAEDLAQTFETSKRTIYRDIQALCEVGVPLVSIPGQGYSLMKGYFLPPLSFTTEEALMLLLGTEGVATNFDAQYRAAAQSAVRKIASVLPEALRADVNYLQNNIRFVIPGMTDYPLEQEKLQQLRRAIIERRVIRFQYYARFSRGTDNEAITREVDPYSLIYIMNSWYLHAYCHLRQGPRHFRLERIEALELLERTFQRPQQFDVRLHEEDKSRNIIVRLLFDQTVARWVRESRSYYVTSEEETAEGLLVTLAIRQESEIMSWLLSWGSHVRVLEPETLRQRLCREAQAIIAHHQTAEMHM